MSKASSEVIRWRCLDGLAWSLLLLSAVVYLPRAGRTYLGDLDLMYMVPVLLGAMFSYRLGNVCWEEGMAGEGGRLWAAWLSLMGLAPFVSWWQRCSDSLYLAIGAMVALGVLGWALLELVAAVSGLAAARSIRRLRREALVARVLLLYLLLIPILALSITFALSSLSGMTPLPSDWLRSWRIIPSWGRGLLSYCPLVAVLNLVRVLFRASTDLVVVAGSEAVASFPGEAEARPEEAVGG